MEYQGTGLRSLLIYEGNDVLYIISFNDLESDDPEVRSH